MTTLFLLFLRILHTAFLSGCTNLHSYQHCMSVPTSPVPHQPLLFLVFLAIAILTGMILYLIIAWFPFSWWLVVLSIFSCVCWSFICVPSLEKRYIRYICPFKKKRGGVVHSIKLLEENIGRTLDDINQSKILYDPPPRVMEIKTKVNEWNLIKLKSFCAAKETISKVKRQSS